MTAEQGVDSTSAESKIVDCKIVAIIRADRPDTARDVGVALITEGIDVLEVSLTTPEALSVISELSGRHDVCIGAGTVLTPEQVAHVAAAGAQFVVAPNADRQVIAASIDHSLPMVAGVYTASDCVTALHAGADFLKLFPASVGGIALMKALSDPFPEARWIPTGGVNVANVVDWWSAGATAVGVGGSLTGAGVAAARATARELRALALSVSGKG